MKPLKIVGLVCLALVLFLVVVGGGVMTLFRRSDAYIGAVSRAVADSTVAARLGAPITPGFFTTGSINLTNDNGVAQLEIPLHGAREDGRLLVGADKKHGVWTYWRLELRTSSNSSSINLIRADSTAQKPPS
jgi:Cytochrome oxidase complex assembly protein 1